MCADRQDGQSLENNAVDDGEDPVGVGVEDDPQHHKPEQRRTCASVTARAFREATCCLEWPASIYNSVVSLAYCAYMHPDL